MIKTDLRTTYVKVYVVREKDYFMMGYTSDIGERFEGRNVEIIRSLPMNLKEAFAVLGKAKLKNKHLEVGENRYKDIPEVDTYDIRDNNS